MKKLIGLLCIVILCAAGVIGYVNWKQVQEPDIQENDADGEPFSHCQVELTNVAEMEDGWIYKMSIISDKLKSTETIHNNYDLTKNYIFTFEGMNLKYKQLDGSGIPMIDKETGEILDVMHSTVTALSDVDNLRDEVSTVKQYFQSKKFMTPITEDDLIDLEIEYFDKNILLTMFNEAIQNEQSYGNFAFIPITALIQHGDEQEMFQGGYVVGYGTLRACMFEVRHDGVFVSDKIKDETASQEEMELQANLDALEEFILRTQKFSLEEISWPYPDQMNETRVSLLNQILKDLYTGNQFGGEE